MNSKARLLKEQNDLLREQNEIQSYILQELKTNKSKTKRNINDGMEYDE